MNNNNQKNTPSSNKHNEGINFSNESNEMHNSIFGKITQSDSEKTQKFPEYVYNNLPKFLQECTSQIHDPYWKDMILLASLNVIAPTLVNISTLHDCKKIYPALFTFIWGSSACGKGNIVLCTELVNPICNKLREKYNNDCEKYESENSKNENKIKIIKQPIERTFFIPADSNSAAIIKRLSHNNGKGLIFATEADILSNSFKRKDYGDFSAIIREGFHHDTINKETKIEGYISIEIPRFSVLLTGTPNQIKPLVNDIENGLFSRFQFYHVPIGNRKNISNNKTDLTVYYKSLGEKYYQFYTNFKKSQDVKVNLSEKQEEELEIFLSKKEYDYNRNTEYSESFLAVIRRNSIQAKRKMMIFTALRQMEHKDVKNNTVLTVSDNDFAIVLAIENILLKHAEIVYSNLTSNKSNKQFIFIAKDFAKSLHKGKSYQEIVDILKLISHSYANLHRSTVYRWINNK